MVYFIREKGRMNVAWYDGSLPTKKSLLRCINEKRLGASGVKHDGINKFGLQALSSTETRSRYKLITDLLSSYVESHLYNTNTKSNNYQIAVLRPKWSKSSIPPEVEFHLTHPFNHDRYFAEHDKLLEKISKEDYLHLPPYIPYLGDREYFQLVATYPCTDKDLVYNIVERKLVRSKGPVLGLIGYLGQKRLDVANYYNWPIFVEQLQGLLSLLGSKAITGESIREPLSKKGFEILSHKST